MKRVIIVFLMMCMALSSCVKDLESNGIYEKTVFKGELVDKASGAPACNVRVVLTDGNQRYDKVTSDANGLFEIEVSETDLKNQYRLLIEADSLFLTKEVSLSEYGYGNQEIQLGTIPLDGPTLPTIQNVSIEVIGPNTVQVSGLIESEGRSHVVRKGFCYSTFQYPTINDNLSVLGEGEGVFAGALTDLSLNMKYYIRAFATNGVGTAYSEQKEVSTLSGLAELTTGDVSAITATSVIANGEARSDGGFPITERGICWSLSATPTIMNSHTYSGTGIGSYSCQITNLDPGRTYHYRAYATNSAGTSYGETGTFTTQSGLASVVTQAVSQITSSSAISGGTISNDGGFGVMERGVCYSTMPNPTYSGLHTTDGSGTGTFVSELIGLASNTIYYVRAYARNSVGVVYGSQESFRTE